MRPVRQIAVPADLLSGPFRQASVSAYLIAIAVAQALRPVRQIAVPADVLAVPVAHATRPFQPGAAPMELRFCPPATTKAAAGKPIPPPALHRHRGKRPVPKDAHHGPA